MAPAAPVLAYPSLDSTNAEARRLAEAGEVGPVWISAAVQTAGKGRRDRAWIALSGNLSATLLLTLDRQPAEAAQLAFVAALAVADLASAYVPPTLVSLKWPNDVLLGGAKVCGVLIESGGAGQDGLWLAVGVGMNLVRAPADTEFPAAALADHLRVDVARPPTPEAALAVLAEAFADWQDRWEREGFGVIRAAWTARAAGLGQTCTARLDREAVTGMAEGLDDDGALILRTQDGVARRITAGDVFFAEG